MPSRNALHSWDLSPREAFVLQARLAGDITEAPCSGPLRLIAGGDVAICPNQKRLVAAWVIWNLATREIIETTHAVRPLDFPYVPGLLSFREAPALLDAADRFTTTPDALMLDGQGRAHPRRFGLASHVGLLMGLPSLGCAKSRLCGVHREPGPRVGSSVRLLDGDEIIGRVLRTRAGVKPVYVSVGHLMSLADAVILARRCCTRYRIPEPTRLAHRLVTELRQKV